MNFEITKGKIKKPYKVVVYGPEGIGKSTFASHFPDPLFIDTEGSTRSLDIKRLPKPTSYEMLKQEVDYIIQNNTSICRTLVIDSIDWGESLIVQDICNKYQKKGIEDFGYGNGYVYTKEEVGRLLNRLENVIDSGVNVVLTAHAQIRKFEKPDESGAFDRYELKLGKKTASQTAPLVKEWADMVLFANYQTFVSKDEKGKTKVSGNRRVMYTVHNACWDAKNRDGLPEMCDFDYAVIKPIIEEPLNNVSNAPVNEKPQTQVNVPVEPKEPQIETGDYYENLAYVGKKIDGTPIIIIFDKALCTSGFSIEGENKKMVVPEAEFECYAELEQADKNVLPYHIYYPNAVAA